MALAPAAASAATASPRSGCMISRYATRTSNPVLRNRAQICSKGWAHWGSREPCAKRTMPSFNAAALVQSLAAPFVDALQETQRPQADRAVRERVAEVLDDVERDRHVQASEHARSALGIDARHHRVVLAVHEMDARRDARAEFRVLREARRERDHRAG